LKTFNGVVRAANYYYPIEVPTTFEGFVTLYFPDEKAFEVSKDKDLAHWMLQLKSGTSVKKVKELSKLNPWIEYLIWLVLKISEDQNLDVPQSVTILNGLLTAIQK
jgi:hypothetical protein